MVDHPLKKIAPGSRRRPNGTKLWQIGDGLGHFSDTYSFGPEHEQANWRNTQPGPGAIVLFESEVPAKFLAGKSVGPAGD